MLTTMRTNFSSALQEQLQQIKEAGTYKLEHAITTPQNAHIGANNYLGLANHPKLVEAAKKALDSHGFGMASVRFICGTQDKHEELEARLSAFHNTQATILFPSCFDANAGIFEALLGPEDAVFSDELNHASIVDGIRLCKAKRHRFRHADLSDLEANLAESVSAGSRHRLIVTDGVFSMDGHVAPVAGIAELAAKYDAQVMVDDCHATGFVGPGGRGSAAAAGVEVDIVSSTLGKALGGGTGGYITGRQEVIDMLRQRARTYLFTNTLAPSMAAATIAALDLLEASPQLQQQLESNTALFRREMASAGFNIVDGSHPIVPIMIGDAALAADMAARMLKRGIYVVGFSYPVVPRGKARIRTQLSAAHTPEDLLWAVEQFRAVGKELGLVS